MPVSGLALLWLLALGIIPAQGGVDGGRKEAAEKFLGGGQGHSNNWAVLVCTSRFWFNYRHVANVLSLYHSVKRLGIPDSQIILMLADDMPCNARNPRPATIFNNAHHHIDLYGEDVEVDYRGYEVTVENFVRVMTGRLPSATPRNKRLLSSHDSNVLVYLTGHGGDGFLKFQDAEELTHQDLADAVHTAYQGLRYNEMLVMVDTCQAASMYQRLYSPGVLATGSSLVGQDSLSHHVDRSIGVYIIDRYTYYLLEFLNPLKADSKKPIQSFLDACPKHKCLSDVGVRYDLYQRDTRKVPTTDFLASVRNVAFLDRDLSIPPWLLEERAQAEKESSLPQTLPTPQPRLHYATQSFFGF